MAEAVLYDADVDAMTKGGGGRAVPEVMGGEVLVDAGGGEEDGHLARDVGWIDGAAGAGGDDEVQVCPVVAGLPAASGLDLAVICERLPCGIRQVDRAHRGGRLRAGLDEGGASVCRIEDNGLADDGNSVWRDIPPAEAECFGASHPFKEHQMPGGREPVAGGDGEEGGELFVVQYFVLTRGVAWLGDVVHYVRGDEAVALRVGEDLVEAEVEELKGAAADAGLVPTGEGGLEHGAGEGLHADGTEIWDNVVFNGLAVGGDGRRLEAGGGGLQPGISDGGERLWITLDELAGISPGECLAL